MKTLTYIRQYIAEHVNAPAIRDIQDALGYSSTSMVMLDIAWLVGRGDLVRTRPPGSAKAFTTPEALRAVKALSGDQSE